MIGWYPGGGPYSDRSGDPAVPAFRPPISLTVPADRFWFERPRIRCAGPAPEDRDAELPAPFQFPDERTWIPEIALRGVHASGAGLSCLHDSRAIPVEQKTGDVPMARSQHAPVRWAPSPARLSRRRGGLPVGTDTEVAPDALERDNGLSGPRQCPPIFNFHESRKHKGTHRAPVRYRQRPIAFQEARG